MNFLRVNVTFYDAVNIIHDVTITRNSYQFTAKILFVGVRITKDQQMIRLKRNRIVFSRARACVRA